MIGGRACVRVNFSAADERLARNFHARGVPLAQIARAIRLDCVRKYVALLNDQTPMLITSLHYFSLIVEEVAETDVGDGYWSPVWHKAEQLERRWVDCDVAMPGQRSIKEKPFGGSSSCNGLQYFWHADPDLILGKIAVFLNEFLTRHTRLEVSLIFLKCSG
jgi:hypothetical protein